MEGGGDLGPEQRRCDEIAVAQDLPPIRDEPGSHDAGVHDQRQCDRQRVERMKRDEIRRLACGVQPVSPHAVRLLQAVELLHQRVDLAAVFCPVHDRKRRNLPIDIDDRVNLSRSRNLLHTIALLEPRRISGLPMEEIEGLPALCGNLEGADVRLIVASERDEVRPGPA